jgi:hypothetical protein
MPTGYTDAIKDGISFNTFALNCARAFGATITMRDDAPGGEAIPEVFEPDSYHLKALAAARETLQCLESMTAPECELKAAAEHTAGEVRRIERLKELDDLRQKYTDMLACAESWTAPTPDHVGLKEFMVKQIQDSIKWDCDTSFYAEPAKLLTGLEWAEAAKARALWDIEYHKTKHAAEVKRTDERNAWIAALRASLNPA